MSVGYGMLATAGGDGLEAVFAGCAGRPVEAIDDELARLGVVLIVAEAPAARA